MKELNFLIRTLKTAYKKCIKGKLSTIEKKDGDYCLNDLVTNCDLATEKFVLHQIAKHYPNDNIVSEEINSANTCHGRCWILDPIDGTIDFAHNLPMWCLQAAFVENGEVKCSVIYCPTLNEMIVSDGEKTTVNGKKIVRNKNIKLSAAIINFCDFVQTNNTILKAQIELIKYLTTKCSKIKIFGSAGYELGCVATGKSDAYILITNHLWDIEPGKLICKNAGCEIHEGVFHGERFVVASANKEIENTILEAFKMTE